eukprot:766857-Hanusia_phi.AAC.1
MTSLLLPYPGVRPGRPAPAARGDKFPKPYRTGPNGPESGLARRGGGSLPSCPGLLSDSESAA